MISTEVSVHFSCLTLFPELVQTVVESSITGRGLKKDCFSFQAVQIRQFADNHYGKIDDALFGGGTGLLLMAEPVWQATQYVSRQFLSRHPDGREKRIFLSPRGTVFTQKKAQELLKFDHLILLCGHYEGVDQRALDALEMEEVSIGDFVLTGGELPACILIDAIARMIPGVLPNEQAWQEESHASGLLETGHYTRPATWNNRTVPDVLTSGHDARIQEFRQVQSIWQTVKNRPDLLKNKKLSPQEWTAFCQWLADERESANSESLPAVENSPQ